MGYPITCDELRRLSTNEAIRFYRKWGALNGIWPILDVNPYLCEVLLDTSVLFGPGRAIRWMQLEAGCDDDGIIGPDTMTHVSYAPRRVAQGLLARRIMHHAYKVKTEPRQAVFLMGWMQRCTDLMRLA